MNKLYADLFLSVVGSEVLADLRDAYYDRAMFQPGEDTSGLTLAFREGQRSVILDILFRVAAGQESDKELPTEATDKDELDG